MIRKRIFGILMIFGVLAMLLPRNAAVATAATSPAPSRVRLQDYAKDVTDTPRGQELVAQAAANFKKNGADADTLKAFELAPGDYVITPAAAELNVSIRQDADGTTQRDVAFTTIRKPSPAKATPGQVSALSASYDLIASQCFARSNFATAYMDTCYDLNKYSTTVYNGNHGAYEELYALTFHGTASPTTIKGLYESWIDVKRNATSSSMDWQDWSPRTNTTGNCRSVSVGFSYGGASVSLPVTMCEEWIVAKSATPGALTVSWWYDRLGRGTTSSNREVAGGVQVFVPTGGWPVWDLTWNALTR